MARIIGHSWFHLSWLMKIPIKKVWLKMCDILNCVHLERVLVINWAGGCLHLKGNGLNIHGTVNWLIFGPPQWKLTRPSCDLPVSVREFLGGNLRVIALNLDICYHWLCDKKQNGSCLLKEEVITWCVSGLLRNLSSQTSRLRACSRASIGSQGCVASLRQLRPRAHSGWAVLAKKPECLSGAGMLC